MMSTARTLTRRLYGLASECTPSEFKAVAFEEFRQVLGFDAAIAGIAERHPSGTPLVREYHERDIDPESTRVWIADNLMPADRATHEAQQQIGVTHRFHSREYFHRQEDRAVQAFAQRFGRENFLITMIPTDPANAFFWASLYRTRTSDRFADSDTAMCQSVMPDLAESYLLNRQLDSGGASRPAPPTRPSLAMLSRRTGRLLTADLEFGRILSLEWPSADASTLPPALMVAFTASPTGDYIGTTIVARRRPVGDLDLIEIRRKSPVERLSPQRATAARMFAMGRTHKEIARAMRVAPGTVRNHLAAAYRILDIDSKAALAELFRLVPDDTR